MPTEFHDKFPDYLYNSTSKSGVRRVFKSYLRMIKLYGYGTLDEERLLNKTQFNELMDKIGKDYTASRPLRTKPRWNRGQAQQVENIFKHYLTFLKRRDEAHRETVEFYLQALEQAGELDFLNTEQAKKKILQSIALRTGQRKFRNDLLIAYDGHCAITGTCIEDILEAAHIVPYNGESSNDVRNGLLLRADIHVLFDLGLLAVDPKSFAIICSEKIRQEPLYWELNGKKLRPPKNSDQRPNEDALRIHFERRVR